MINNDVRGGPGKSGYCRGADVRYLSLYNDRSAFIGQVGNSKQIGSRLCFFTKKKEQLKEERTIERRKPESN